MRSDRVQDGDVELRDLSEVFAAHGVAVAYERLARAVREGGLDDLSAFAARIAALVER